MATIERTKNASRNIVFGTILVIYQTLASFLMRTAMIYFMGVQYLGLNSLFISIFNVLNLAELGVGSAMVYSMYKPIAEDNHETICALLKLYKKYYRIIGLVIGVIGVIITPFIPNLINGQVPEDINIFILYYIYLCACVISYWLLAYKHSLLYAHQRNDIASRILLVTNSIQYTLQIVVLYFFRNYYYYILIMLVMQAVTNIITAIYASKLYPLYEPIGYLDKENVKQINQRVKDLFTTRVGGVIINSADTIVISAFLGLKTLALYQNYYFIMVTIISFINVLFTSITGGIGNSLVVETKEKNFNDFIKFTFSICLISTLCSCCFLNLYQPFIELWLGKEFKLNFSIVICLVIYFFVYEINQLMSIYKDAGGIWHKDRFRPLFTALVNLILNLITVNYLGLYGIILSTAISLLLVGMPWLFHNLFNTLFPNTYLKPYLKKLIKYIIVSLITTFISIYICNFININLILTIVLRGLICIVITIMTYVLFFRKEKEFNENIELLKLMYKNNIFRK